MQLYRRPRSEPTPTRNCSPKPEVPAATVEAIGFRSEALAPVLISHSGAPLARSGRRSSPGGFSPCQRRTRQTVEAGPQCAPPPTPGLLGAALQPADPFLGAAAPTLPLGWDAARCSALPTPVAHRRAVARDGTRCARRGSGGGSAPRRLSGVCRCRVSETGISSVRAVRGLRSTKPVSPCSTQRRHHLATVPRDRLIWRATSAWGSPAATFQTSNNRPAGVKRALPCCSCELFMPLFVSFRP